MENVVVSPCMLVAIGFPALKGTIVHLSDDTSGRLKGIDPVVGRLWGFEGRNVEVVGPTFAGSVYPQSVHIGYGQPGDKSVVGARLPKVHHEALRTQNAGVGAGADLCRCPEEVETGRVVLLGLDVALAVEVLDRLLHGDVGIWFGNDLSNHSNAVAPEIAAEPG